MKPSELGIQSLAFDLDRVESLLAASVAASAEGPGLGEGLLSDASAHLLGAGGKRLRPTLSLCAAYATTGVGEPATDEAVTGAAAVELVHMGSLYHDDVIDEAATRRGVPSVNARWSNIVAILAGDYLLAQASALAASLGADVAGLLARTIGELCRGQVLELQHLFDVDRTEESYFSSVSGKTASLMATACRIGGMVSELEPDSLDSLTSFGHHLGMCFQIVDDVLDVTRSDEDLGKPAGNDLHEGVYTLPVIRALKDSNELRTMLGRSIDWPDVAKARSMVSANGAVETSLDAARDHAHRATAAIRSASSLDVDVTTRLGALVDGLVDRSS